MPSRQARPSGRRRPLLSHRKLLVAEAILILGLVQMALRDHIMRNTELPATLRVAFGMALVLGIFGGLIVFSQRTLTRSLDTTHRVVQRLPVPLPVRMVHVGFLMLIGWSYAWYWGLDQAVATELIEQVGQWTEFLGTQRIVGSPTPG